MSLQRLSQEGSGLTLQKDEISLYSGQLTTQVVVASVAKIKAAFPALPGGFYDTLAERITANGFCDERLRDAVNHVIDNCPYPTPTIANFISYDRTLRFKTYDEMCKDALTSDSVWKQWLPVKFPDRSAAVWVYVNDIAKYKLEKYQVK